MAGCVQKMDRNISLPFQEHPTARVETKPLPSPSSLPTLTGSHLHEAGDGLDSPVCLIEGIHPGIQRAIFCLKVLWIV